AVRRVGLLALGWTAVALGGIGIVVPVLPTTGFFVLAAACFARSSPRFERWVLDLPKVGPLVRDHRAGLGMPRRVKLVAIGMMLGLGAVGTWYVGWRVPTRERVLAASRHSAGGAPAARDDPGTAAGSATPTTDPRATRPSGPTNRPTRAAPPSTA